MINKLMAKYNQTINNIICILFFCCLTFSIKAQMVFYPTGNTSADFNKTFTIPACINTVTVEVWGGSGAGKNGSATTAGSGGGGGAYSRSVLNVTPGTTYSIQIGTPGNSGGINGGDTWFSLNSTKLVLAKGGFTSTGTAGGVGGAAASGIGAIQYSGGNGGNANNSNAGGGGGSTAGSGGSGNNGSIGTGSVGGAGGSMATGNVNGGGAFGGNNNGDGNSNQYCYACGGGGGGGIGSTNGGFGSSGMVKITLPPSLKVSVNGPQTICPGSIPQALKATASGGVSSVYKYQWQYADVDPSVSVNFYDLTGFDTTATYIPQNPLIQTTWYRAVAIDSGCIERRDTSLWVKVSVEPLSTSLSFSQTICSGSVPSPLKITTQPASATINAVWYISNTGFANDFSIITSATGNTYTPDALTSVKYYKAEVSSVGCVTDTTNVVSITTSVAPATCNVGRNPAIMYNTNTLPLINSSVGGSVTTGAWSIVSGSGTLSTINQTDKPEEVIYSPSQGYVGAVVLQLTTNPNGCAQCISTKTINVLASTVQTVAFSAPGTYSWTAPACVSTITVGTWGAGGGGATGGCVSSPDGTGGAGGAYSAAVLSVVQGQTYSLSVGAGGSGATWVQSPNCIGIRGVSGQGSWFANPSAVYAQGGSGGIGNSQPGYGLNSAGGQASAGYGNLEKRSGGDGESPGQNCLWAAGGGGSSAGPGYNGNTAPDLTVIYNNGVQACAGGPNYNSTVPGGIAPPTEAGAGGVGGYSGPNIQGFCKNNTGANMPSNGGFPGGGGGGGTNGCNSDGAAGGNGQVKIWYSPQNPIFLYTKALPSATVCQGETVTLIADSDYSTQYYWSDGKNNYTGSSITFTATATTTYTLSSTLDCSNPVLQTVTVNSIPTATISGYPNACQNSNASIRFSASKGKAPYTINYLINDSITNSLIANPGYTVSIPTDSSGKVSYALISITDANGCSRTQNDSLSVVIHPLPTATVSGSATVCQNAVSPNITFSASSGTLPYTFVYKINGGSTQTLSSVSGSTQATVAASATTAGNYTYSLITVSDANGCYRNTNESVVINVNPLPQGSIIGQGRCSNDSSSVASIVWGSSAGLGYYHIELFGSDSVFYSFDSVQSNVSINLIPAGTPSVTTVYTLMQVTDGNSCTRNSGFTIATATVVVSSDTIVLNSGASVNQTICAGQTVNLSVSASNVSRYNWQMNDGNSGWVDLIGSEPGASYAGIHSASLSISDATNNITGYKFRAALIPYCGITKYSDSVVLYVNSLPTATVSGSATVCQNAASPSILFTANNGVMPYTFVYKINGGSSQSVITTSGNSQASIAQSTTVTGIYTYSLTGVSDANGCSSNVSGLTTATVKVNGLPTATVSGSATVCQNAASPSISFTASNGVVPYAFVYKINGGSNQTLTTSGNNNQASVTQSTTTLGNYTYSIVSVSDANGCSKASGSTTTVKVNGLPTATVSGSATVCQNATSPGILFGASNGTAPYTFVYKINGGSSQSVITTSGNSQASIAQSTTTTGIYTYSLTGVSDANGCSSNVSGSTATIKVNGLPTATVSGSATVCQNTTSPSILFAASNGIVPYSFVYKINGGSNQTLTTSGNNNQASVTQSTTTLGNYTYSIVSVSDANGCSKASGSTATVKVNGLPTATVSGSATVCQNATSPNILFAASNGTVPYTFVYKINGGSNQTITSAANSNQVNIAQSTTSVGSFTYSLISVSDANNCSQIQNSNIAIRINSLPIATISGSATVCQNAASPNVTFTGSGGAGPYIFSYKINGSMTNTIIANPTYTLVVPTNNPGIFNYSLVNIKDANSCSRVQNDSVIINLLPLLDTTNNSTVPLKNEQTVCINDSIVPVVVNLRGISAHITYSNNIVPSGIISTYSSINKKFTIKGIPIATGIYSYSITDIGYCDSVIAFTGKITIGDNNVKVSIYSVNTTGANKCDGYIEAKTVGGEQPYTYHWGDSSQVNSPYRYNVCKGIYDVTVISSGACSITQRAYIGTDTIAININPLVVVATTQGVSSDMNCDGEAFVKVSGGVPPYSVIFSKKTFLDSLITIDSLCAGFYTVNVKDSELNSASFTFVISSAVTTFTNVPIANTPPSFTLVTNAINNCNIDYTDISTIRITSYTVSNNILNAIWTITLKNGDTYEQPAKYTISGFGIYQFIIDLYCTGRTSYYAKGIDELNVQNTSISFFNKTEDILVFPNPFKDKIQVIMEYPSTIEISNALGIIIHRSNTYSLNTIIDLDSFASGIYFIRIKNTNNEVVKKLIKQ